MSNVQSLQLASTAPNNIQVGPVMLWTNVTKPADGAILLVSGNVSGATDQRVYGPVLYTISGTFMGSTIGQSQISYKPSFVDVSIEQSAAKVEKVLNMEEAHCTFAVAELRVENVQQTIPGSYWNQPLATVTTQTDPLMAGQTDHILKIGGLRLVNPQCIAFISPNRRIGLVGTGPFSYVFCGYNAVGTEGFQAAFSRGKETVFNAGFELLSDTARTVGDQLCQFVVREAS